VDLWMQYYLSMQNWWIFYIKNQLGKIPQKIFKKIFYLNLNYSHFCLCPLWIIWISPTWPYSFSHMVTMYSLSANQILMMNKTKILTSER